jgi:hypothetical protein
MITIEECKKTLQQDGNEYSTEDLENIQGFLRNLAEIAIKEYQKKNGKGDFIYAGKHR